MPESEEMRAYFRSLDVYDCAIWRLSKDGGAPVPEKHYLCNHAEIERYFDEADTDCTCIMFECWRTCDGYNPNKNFVWNNPSWESYSA